MEENREEEERRKHFRNALSNHAPILAIGDDDLGKQLEKADEGLSFPASPIDILEYLGNIDPLGLSEFEKKSVRATTQDIINQHGVRYVWDSRFRHKLEIAYIYHIL